MAFEAQPSALNQVVGIGQALLPIQQQPRTPGKKMLK